MTSFLPFHVFWRLLQLLLRQCRCNLVHAVCLIDFIHLFTFHKADRLLHAWLRLSLSKMGADKILKVKFQRQLVEDDDGVHRLLLHLHEILNSRAVLLPLSRQLLFQLGELLFILFHFHC